MSVSEGRQAWRGAWAEEHSPCESGRKQSKTRLVTATDMCFPSDLPFGILLPPLGHTGTSAGLRWPRRPHLRSPPWRGAPGPGGLQAGPSHRQPRGQRPCPASGDLSPVQGGPRLCGQQCFLLPSVFHPHDFPASPLDSSLCLSICSQRPRRTHFPRMWSALCLELTYSQLLLPPCPHDTWLVPLFQRQEWELVFTEHLPCAGSCTKSQM